MKEEDKYILVYGSLRKGDYNYDRFKEAFGSDFEYVSTMEIAGFDLYDLGHYPGVKRNPATETPLTVDIIKVSSNCYDQIYAMEYHADYKPFKIEVINGTSGESYDCTMYIYNGPVSKENYVEKGDWIKYINNSYE